MSKNLRLRMRLMCVFGRFRRFRFSRFLTRLSCLQTPVALGDGGFLLPGRPLRPASGAKCLGSFRLRRNSLRKGPCRIITDISSSFGDSHRTPMLIPNVRWPSRTISACLFTIFSSLTMMVGSPLLTHCQRLERTETASCPNHVRQSSFAN